MDLKESKIYSALYYGNKACINCNLLITNVIELDEPQHPLVFGRNSRMETCGHLIHRGCAEEYLLKFGNPEETEMDEGIFHREWVTKCLCGFPATTFHTANLFLETVSNITPNLAVCEHRRALDLFWANDTDSGYADTIHVDDGALNLVVPVVPVNAVPDMDVANMADFDGEDGDVDMVWNPTWSEDEGDEYFSCTDCGHDFDSHLDMQLHQLHEHRRGFQCDLCGIYMDRYEALKDHVEIHHNVILNAGDFIH